MGPGAAPGAVVVDASALVWLLLDPGDRGAGIAERLRGRRLAAPALSPFEVANVVRRRWAAGLLTVGEANQALGSLQALGIELWPWEAVATRVWELRGQITAYDASYVALAELLGAPLLTADEQLARAAPPTCRVELSSEPPPARGDGVCPQRFGDTLDLRPARPSWTSLADLPPTDRDFLAERPEVIVPGAVFGEEG
jgi:predicted nucleic acid-binding protein